MGKIPQKTRVNNCTMKKNSNSSKTSLCPSHLPDHAERGVAMAGPRLSQLHIPSRQILETSTVQRGRLHGGKTGTVRCVCGQGTTGKARRITHFTDASRRRMLDLLAKVIYAALPFWMDLTTRTISQPREHAGNEIWKFWRRVSCGAGRRLPTFGSWNLNHARAA